MTLTKREGEQKNLFWMCLLTFLTLLVAILLMREFLFQQLIQNGIRSYHKHMLLGIGANCFLIALSYFFIKENALFSIAGLGDSQAKNSKTLIFPLMYLVTLNLVLMDEVSAKFGMTSVVLLLIYCVSVGLSEELSVRGFLQSYLIKYFGESRIVHCIFASALIFGLLHLIKFDKGAFGELSQIGYAVFIGVMFGALLIVTKRIYPLVIIHTIADFTAKFDAVGRPIEKRVAESVSMESSILIVMLVAPCLLYALFLIRRYGLRV